ncbi:pilus assembly protein [Draconibacterium mangrovi]|uniref:hypothetical protein n=1 Tax=Draconibacterium mangrovi TaxID=2697469 RepID=UPI0013D29BAC|nr:hypothetical protein [Draconibacterium mangrovi]
MKKLIFLLTAVVMTAFSSGVFAQSTGVEPAPGATHNYNIAPGDGGNTILWTVTKGNLTTSAGTEVVIATPSAASTNITWTTSIDTTVMYYVHVLETDGAGCSNEKVLPVNPEPSDFYLEIAAANATQCYDGAVVVSLADPTTINYDHGTATINFTITPNNLSASYTGYTFDLALAVPTGFDYTTTPPTFSANASWDGTTVTVTDNSLVTVSFAVDNTNTYDNSSAADAQDFTATASVSGGKAINGVSDNGDGTYSDATNVARPNTSGIGYN